MMELLRDGLFNIIEIKNNEIIQSFLVGRSWRQWCLSKNSFCTRGSRKKDVFGDLTTKLTKRKVVWNSTGACDVKAVRWLKSFTKFAHNILKFLSNFNNLLKFQIKENPMQSSKVADCLIYVTFITYLFRILTDDSCLFIVQCQK